MILCLSLRECAVTLKREADAYVPAKPSWLLHIPEIVSELSGLDTPVVDRAVCERLFHVGRRQANHLMRGFGGYLSGNTVLLDRADLISALEQLANTPEVAHEHTRKRRLADALDELNHRQRADRQDALTGMIAMLV
jgi:hypothetical protein